MNDFVRHVMLFISTIDLIDLSDAYPQHVSPGIVVLGPAESREDLGDIRLWQGREETVEQDLQPDRDRLRPKQTQRSDLEGCGTADSFLAAVRIGELGQR